MGRGWRAAERQGKDVTERVLAAARRGRAAPAHTRPAWHRAAAATNGVLAADSLGLELLALLASGPAGSHGAWRLAAALPGALSQ